MSKLYFTKSHEWVLVEGDKAKIGLSDHAQHELGDLVFVELPEVGAEVCCGKPFCNVESVKAVSEVYSPVCGKVVAVNEELETAPETVNNAPMEAWIAEVEVAKLSDELMTEEEYAKFLGK